MWGGGGVDFYHTVAIILQDWLCCIYVTCKVQSTNGIIGSLFSSVVIGDHCSVTGGPFPHLVWTGRTFTARRHVSSAGQPRLLHAREHHSPAEPVHVWWCWQLMMPVLVYRFEAAISDQDRTGAKVLLNKNFVQICALAHRKWVLFRTERQKGVRQNLLKKAAKNNREQQRMNLLSSYMWKHLI